jgi:hypothetical protein
LNKSFAFILLYLALSFAYTILMRQQLEACTAGSSKNSVINFFQVLAAKHSFGCKGYGYFVTKVDGYIDYLIALAAAAIYTALKSFFGHSDNIKSTIITLTSPWSGNCYDVDHALLTCTCADWKFRRSQNGAGPARCCKHLRLVLSDLAGVPFNENAVPACEPAGNAQLVLPDNLDDRFDEDGATADFLYLALSQGDMDDMSSDLNIPETRIVLYES